MNFVEQLQIKGKYTLLLLSLTSFDLSTEEGRANERYRRVVLSVLASGIARVISISTSLITVPLTLSYLGVERYGLWMIISSFTVLLNFADLGLGNGLLNTISEANGREDREAARRYVSSAFVMLSIVALVLGIAFVSLYSFIDWTRLFNLKSDIAIRESGPTLAAFILCFLLNLPLGVVQRVQLGYQQGYSNSLWQAVGSLVTLLVVLFVIYLRSGLPYLVMALVGTPVVILGIQGLVVLGFQYPWLRPTWKLVSFSAMRFLLRLGILFFILQVAVSVAYATDNLIITQFLGPEFVAQYAVAARLYSIPTSILSMLFIPLWPAYGEAIARGDTAWVKRTLLRSLLTVLVIAGIPCVIFASFGKTIIEIWAGPSVLPQRNLLIALSAWTIISASGNAVAMFLNGANIVKFQVLCASLMAPIAVLIKFLLTPQLGISGVVWGTLIAYVPLVVLPMSLYIPHILRRLDSKQHLPKQPNSDLVSAG